MRPSRLLRAAVLVHGVLTGCGGIAASTSSGDAGVSGSTSGSGASGSASSGDFASGALSGSAASGAAVSGSASSGVGATGASSGAGPCPVPGTCAPSPCAGASVTFEMRVSPTANASFCANNSCSSQFVTIRGPDQQQVAIDRPVCAPDCDTCQAPSCPPVACVAPQVLTSLGVSQVWDGAQWPPSACGAGISCQRKSCTPAGHYVATMCAYLNSGLAPLCTPQTPVCQDFGFDWPPPSGSAVISWTIGGDADAGSPESAGACFTDQVPVNYRFCAVDSDCTVKKHQIDCCGTDRLVGVSNASAEGFDLCEQAWARHFGLCMCASNLSTTDDGKIVTDPSNVTVTCAPLRKGFGTCRTTVLPTDGGGGVGVCVADTDCGPGLVCGFPEAPACALKGQCLVPSPVGCNGYSPGCACDGSEISVVCTGLPTGYFTKPLRHKGVCVDGG